MSSLPKLFVVSQIPPLSHPKVRLTHKKSGTYKEDVGASDSIDRIMGTAVAHALKGSITDALKRAARHFGEKLGNTLYQGDFSISKAPLTLQEALDQYDNERAANKFGPSTNKPPSSSNGEACASTDTWQAQKAIESNANQAEQGRSKSEPGASTSKPVSIVKDSLCRKVAIDTKLQLGGAENRQSWIPAVAKTPSASSGPNIPTVSATPAANKFRNSTDSREPINLPKLQMPSSHPNFPPNNGGGPLPPLSSAERLRSQSSMFSGGPFTTDVGNSEKENTFQNAQQQEMGRIARPSTSTGRKFDPYVVDWSRQQPKGVKRPANTSMTPALDAQSGNKRLNSNPYIHK